MSKGLIAIEGTPEAPAWWSEAAALTSVANAPLLAHAVAAVRRAGAGEVIVAAAPETLAAARRALGSDADELSWVACEGPQTPTAAIAAASDMLAGERFLLHVTEGMLVRDRGTLAAALADESADATVFFHADQAADPIALPIRARRASPSPQERLAGVHAFGPAMLEVVADLIRRNPRARLADAVERLADGGGVVQGGVLEDWWRFRSSPQDLLDVNRRALDEIDPSVEGEDLTGARIEGRVRIHPTATVRNSVVRGPVVIGAHAHVTDAYVGPYAAIGDGAVIENAQVACSVVLPRARIRHVGVRVEDSIVGAGASVGRDFGLPNAIRLVVGRDANVTLG